MVGRLQLEEHALLFLVSINVEPAQILLPVVFWSWMALV